MAGIQDLFDRNHPSTTMIYAPTQLVKHQGTSRLRAAKDVAAPSLAC